MQRQAFENLKVADFSSWVIGPLVTKSLADYGATVVLVESLKKPPNQRTTLPFKDNRPGLNRSGMFAYSGANKYSVSLDLLNEGGLEIARQLVGWSDVVVENSTPGVMEKLGLAWEDLIKVKPDIIMLRASAQGQTGPMRTHKALGLQLSALAGIPHFTGYPEREPLSLMFAYPDYVVAFLALAAVGAALDYKLRTGKGQMLDISQFEGILQYMAPNLMEYLSNGRESMRDGNRHPYAAPHGVYPCKGEDAWCAITVFNDTEWDALCRAMGNPEWAEAAGFKTAPDRKHNEESLNIRLGEWTANYPAGDLMQLLQSRGVTSGVVKKGEDIYSDPQLKHRNFLWKLNHAEMGEFTHLGQPAVMSLTPARAKMPSPCIGEHTEFVCRDILGITEEEYDRLLTTGAFAM